MDSLPPGVDLCSVPAAALPEGQTVPNFDDPVSLQTTSIGVSSVLLAFTYLFAAARIWGNKGKLRWSDYLSIIGVIMHTGNVGVILSLGRYNRHQWDIPACWFDATYLKKLYAQVITFGMALLFSKAAILVLYLEIFGIKTGFRIAVYIGLIFNTLMCLTFIPMGSYFNAPHAGLSWESTFSNNPEDNLMPWGIFIGAGSVLLDIYLLLLPLHIIASLNLPVSKRLQLTAVFGTALMGVAASIVAMVYRVKLLQGNNDSTWNEASVAIANVAEDSIALIVGSAPAFSKFLRQHVAESRLWRSILSTVWSRNGGSKGMQSDMEPVPRQPFKQIKPEPVFGQVDVERADSHLFNSTSTTTAG